MNLLKRARGLSSWSRAGEIRALPKNRVFSIRESRNPIADVVVALALRVLERRNQEFVGYAELSRLLCISTSETYKSTRRLILSRLVIFDTVKPILGPLYDYVVYGVPHAFPGNFGGPSRGIATAWAAEPLVKTFPQGNDLPPVWPWAEGNVRGFVVEPLHPKVPQAVRNLPELYEFLALVDALRVGRARDREMARKRLKELLSHDTPVAV